MERIATIDWTEARCATGDARLLHLFFSEETVEIAEAKALCGECPMRLACLEGALARQEPWGIWGGQLFDGGRPIAIKRKRGRPRKDEVERQRRLELELQTMLEDEAGVEVA